METPFDLLPYLSLFSALLVAMKCYVTQYQKNKVFLEQMLFYDVDARGQHRDDRVTSFPIHRLFVSKQRKVPARERSHVSDEEGRRLLVISLIS
ncbi:hypothetical protein [Anoxybacteroides tepidamans]|uniref:hypothetical protein n=1 Tax=Anoxybacteroides tepidamans TaxID=265948 RepID=UPI000481BC97|nr:hypothetical protein [Anoxybacillus tepidamans]